MPSKKPTTKHTQHLPGGWENWWGKRCYFMVQNGSYKYYPLRSAPFIGRAVKLDFMTGFLRRPMFLLNKWASYRIRSLYSSPPLLPPNRAFSLKFKGIAMQGEYLKSQVKSHKRKKNLPWHGRIWCMGSCRHTVAGCSPGGSTLWTRALGQHWSSIELQREA